MELVQIEDARRAAALLKGVAHVTPLSPSRVLSEMTGGPIFLKCENLQRTGSFKIRGAYNRIALLSDAERALGVVAASAGNHAQGVALAASLLGVKATVFMPVGAPLPKVQATSAYGANVVLEGSIYDEAYHAAEIYAKEQSAVLVHPFDHPDVIAGQGVVGLEIMEELPEVGTILVGVGGGGLISGIAAAVKPLRPEVKVVGVEPEGAAGLTRSLEAGHVVTLPQISTVADGLAAKRAGDLTFAHVSKLVDAMVTVTDEEIAEGLLLMAERSKLVVEPAAAAPVAALMRGRVTLAHPVVAVVSGGNIDPLLLLRVLRFAMSSAGRYFSFRTRLSDRPGALHRLTGVIAELQANIVGIEHVREGAPTKYLGEVDVALQVETRGPDHVRELVRRLRRSGYSVEAT
ncbi:MAG: threonine ammonia-lyase [Actinomycetota bacterium]